MKKFTLLFAAFLIGAASIFGQSAASATAQEAAEKAVAKFGFDQTQAAEALKIETRRAKNLAEIEPIRTSDPALFAKKTASAHIGARSSYRRILNSKAQIATYDAMIQALRQAKAASAKALKSKKAPQAEIDAAAAEVEAQF